MRAPEFWGRDGAPARLLAPLGFIHGASVAWKARHTNPLRVGARVICVGNLTAGGSGKTPVAIAIAGLLMGQKVLFLTRGYGGRLAGPRRVEPDDSAAEVGDEALLLACAAPTIMAKDRRAGALAAIAEGARIIVMDDGHQNFLLEKDLSLVVVDGETGFGNGRVIPAGPLREPVAQGLARADAVVVMGPGQPRLDGFNGPVLRAKLVADGAEFSGRRVYAFAGIGRPEKFLASLRDADAIIAGSRFFGDHHFYDPMELIALRTQALAASAVLVTTEKDHARLAPEQRGGIAVLPVRAIFDDPDALARLLDSRPPAV
ncbi:MAG TPA: tetraacyldisaccharide 4'-kinase [Rhizomicrobium sp.]